MSEIRWSGPWSRSEAHAFLDASSIPMRLAANTSSGFPVVLSLWFLRDGDDLLAAVHRDSRIARRLEADRRCAFEIASNDPPYRGVRGQANAERLSDGAERLLRTLLTRYLGSTDSKLGAFLLSRANEELVIRLRPRTMSSWDYTDRMRDS